MSARARAAGASLGLIVLLGGAAAAQSPSSVPPPSADTGPFREFGLPVQPTPGAITEPAPVAWDHVDVSPDGVTLTVFFTNGAEACYGLDHIEVADEGGTVRVTPWVGFRADAAGKRCAAIAQSYRTVVTLDAPVLGGGTPGILGPVVYPGGGVAPVGGPFASLEPGPWDGAQLAPDGQTGWVAWTGGSLSCWGFDHIGVTSADGVSVLSVYTGTLLDAPQVCTLEAVLLQAPFALDAPVLLGGG